MGKKIGIMEIMKQPISRGTHRELREINDNLNLKTTTLPRRSQRNTKITNENYKLKNKILLIVFSVLRVSFYS